jgi:hypothetical protein
MVEDVTFKVLFIDEDSYKSMYLYSKAIPTSVGNYGQEIQSFIALYLWLYYRLIPHQVKTSC